MENTLQEKNKTLVLEAFDTLFNKRDYVSAERFWSPDYIQHSAHIQPGRDGLFNLIKSAPVIETFALIFLRCLQRLNPPCASTARFNRLLTVDSFQADIGNASPNIGFPLLDCSRVASS